MSGSLSELLVVQDLDTALDQHRHRRTTLPERSEIAAIDAEAASRRAESERTAAERAELESRQATIEAELAATEQRSAAISKRMYSGEVSATKDLQAMAAELDHLKARGSALEDGVLEVMEAREPLDARAEELSAALEDLAGRREATVARLAEAEKAVDAEIADLVSRRTEAAAAVPADLLASYEKLRGRLGGVGVARLVGNHCDGCHLTLSAVELDRVRHLPDGEVYTCEQCSRILVP